jgi:hypothetical protein
VSLYGVNSLSPGAFLDARTLAETGNFTIPLDPIWLSTGQVTIRVNTLPPDFSGTITPGDAPVTVATSVAGQNAVITFNGTQGQHVALRSTSSTFTTCGLYATVRKPDLTVLMSTTCFGGNSFSDLGVLPATGAYTITLDPQGTAIGSSDITLYDVPADPTVGLTINGGGQSVTTTVPAQNAGATFSGTAGQQVTVRLTGNTMGSVTVKLRRADGTQLTSGTSSSTSFNLSAQTLPVDGTYSVFVDPSSTNTGSITVAVTAP